MTSLEAQQGADSAVAARARLIELLQLAHSGEKAAAYAYAGHWRSVRQQADRKRIREIEADEWEHRRNVHRMLVALGAAPASYREKKMAVIGRTVGALCFVSGRFIPMYGAGQIERRNVHEYVDAAAYAKTAGHAELIDELLDMAQVEWDHERYFRSQVVGRWQLRFLKLWPELGTRESLRAAPA